MANYTVKEVAALFGVGEETVRRWIREPDAKKRLQTEFNSRKKGHVITEEALEDFLARNPKYRRKLSPSTGNELIRSLLSASKVATTGLLELLPLLAPLFAVGTSLAYSRSNPELAEFANVMSQQLMARNMEIERKEEEIHNRERELRRQELELEKLRLEVEALNKQKTELETLWNTSGLKPLRTDETINMKEELNIDVH